MEPFRSNSYVPACAATSCSQVMRRTRPRVPRVHRMIDKRPALIVKCVDGVRM